MNELNQNPTIYRIPVWAESTRNAGELCLDTRGERDDCDDVVIYRGTATELDEQMDAWMASTEGQAGTDLYAVRTACSIDRALAFGDDTWIDDGRSNLLDNLLESLLNGETILDDRLPTFGGEEPRDTTGIWSWDGARLLVGSCMDDLEIIERGDHE